MCNQTLLPWECPPSGTRDGDTCPTQPWACCHSTIPMCLPGFWEHNVSQGSHQPLLKLPSVVVSQSLSRTEVFVSKGVPWGMESIMENKYPLHCRLSVLRHLYLLCFFCPASIQQRPTGVSVWGWFSRQGPSAHRSSESHPPWCYKLFFTPKSNTQQKSRAKRGLSKIVLSHK